MNQTDPTVASVREQLLDALDFSYCQGLGYAEPAELLAAYDRERVAVVSPPPSRAAVLSDAERTMLTYALDQAQEHIWSRDGFTDEDQVAVDSLRRLAAEAHDTGTQQPEVHANGLPLVKGSCPACRRASLFLGTGGYPTCSNYECPEPDAATTVLEQYANEAHAPSHVWTIESPRRDNWASWDTTYDDRDWAAERYESALSTAPQRPFRLVRATTTYTVEAERQPPTPVAQQPRAVPPGCWYNAAAAEEAMRDEPLDEPGPAMKQPEAEAHSCSNCEGVDPTSCLMNPNRAAAEQQPAPDGGEETRRG